MNSRTHMMFRFGALLQFILALGCAFYALVFLTAFPVHDELGLSRSLRLPFVTACGGAALLLAYGSLRTWRAAHRWWLPLLLTVIGTPVVFLALWVMSV